MPPPGSRRVARAGGAGAAIRGAARGASGAAPGHSGTWSQGLLRVAHLRGRGRAAVSAVPTLSAVSAVPALSALPAQLLRATMRAALRRARQTAAAVSAVELEQLIRELEQPVHPPAEQQLIESRRRVELQPFVGVEHRPALELIELAQQSAGLEQLQRQLAELRQLRAADRAREAAPV